MKLYGNQNVVDVLFEMGETEWCGAAWQHTKFNRKHWKINSFKIVSNITRYFIKYKVVKSNHGL